MLKNAMCPFKKKEHSEKVMRIWYGKQGDTTCIIKQSRQPH